MTYYTIIYKAFYQKRQHCSNTGGDQILRPSNRDKIKNKAEYPEISRSIFLLNEFLKAKTKKAPLKNFRDDGTLCSKPGRLVTLLKQDSHATSCRVPPNPSPCLQVCFSLSLSRLLPTENPMMDLTNVSSSFRITWSNPVIHLSLSLISNTLLTSLTSCKTLEFY